MKSKGTYLLITACIVTLAIFLADDSLAQCSMCRKIATDGANNAKTVGKSINHAILYLMAMPYFLVGFYFRKQITGFVRGLLVKK